MAAVWPALAVADIAKGLQVVGEDFLRRALSGSGSCCAFGSGDGTHVSQRILL
jgi:hypothetical protein